MFRIKDLPASERPLPTGGTTGQVLTKTGDGHGEAGWEDPTGGGGGSGAPTNATYIVQTSNGSLSAEQVLAALSTGILKVTTGTGVLSVATGADLPTHQHAGEDIASGTVAAARIASLDAAKITTGVFPIARLATGTPTGSKFVRDDGTLAIPAGGGGGGATTLDDLSDATITSPANRQALVYNGTNWENRALQAADLPTGIDAAKIGDGSVTNAEFQRLDATSSIQTQLDGKAATSHNHSAADLTSGTLDATRLPTGIDATKIGGGGVTTAEFDRIGGLTSDAQTQIDSKEPALGNPSGSTKVLQSTTGGVRSWVTLAASYISDFATAVSSRLTAVFGTPASDGMVLSGDMDGTYQWINNPAALETKIYVDDMVGPADWQKIQQADQLATSLGGGIVQFSGRTYDISAAPFQTTNGANAQILLANINPFTGELISNRWQGAVEPAFSYSVISSDNTSIPSWSGTVIVSTRTGTGTLPCMVGVKGDSTGAGGFEYFTKLQLSVDKITFRSGNNHATGNPGTPAICTVSALDLRHLWTAKVTNCVVDTGLNNALYVDMDPPATGTVGICLPGAANAGMNGVDNCMVIGFYEGFRWAEHTQVGTIWPSYNVRGVALFGGNNPTHGFYAERISSVWNGTDIYSDDGIVAQVAQLDIEGYDDAYMGAQYFSKAYTIDDPNNNLRGAIRYIAGQQIPGYGLRAFKVSGCSKARIDRVKPLKANMANTGILAGSTTHTNYGNADYYDNSLWAQVPGALNDEISLDFSEAGNDNLWLQRPGLYRLHLIWTSETVAGIVQFSYGTGGYKNSNEGVVDMYEASSTKNHHSTWDIPLYTEDILSALVFKLKITGKNGSSGGHYRYFSGAWIERIG